CAREDTITISTVDVKFRGNSLDVW
nr:immunoglobulin heavy chain junction region [Macaca mulatta]MOW46513.1 immunoglobulin heavy chain junction region [Macaca mulatta]MOW46871.1 immunoglobulin heavy chain junction region [Macaca mulatta]MOW46923.1 immunoglobulin heavy chain junction region [Macaca mulatta]MOW47436.1 immunoglobulin heavy chain junction region [Macaca mulatta]